MHAKYRYIVLLVAVFFGLHLYAERRQTQDVLSIAAGNTAARRLPARQPATAKLSIAHQSTAYFAVNNGTGFVLVSADDQMPEVLAYSDNGAFCLDSLPPAMRYWLECYDIEAEQLLTSDSPAIPQHAASFAAISPLLTCKWNQSQPFNNLAPAYDDNGTKSAAGCVATAMAQIMYYYRYPQQGSGSHSYLWVATTPVGKYATLKADFGATTYDWDNMIDNYKTGYTSQQADAVATLLYHCAVSVDMGFGSSSGAYTNEVPSSLNKYFGYDPNYQRLRKDLYPIDSLNQLIYAELKAKHPVLVSGQNDEGGHAFVCDGADSRGYFHINWGWGGSNDGYFLLSALNPSGSQGIGGTTKGYNQQTAFFIGLQPATTKSSPAIPQMGADSITVSKMKMKRSETFNANAFKMQNFGLSSFNGSYGVALYKEDSNEMIALLKQTGNMSLSGGYYWVNTQSLASVSVPASVANGTYNLCFVYKDANYDWMRMLCLADDYYKTVTITSDSIVFYPNDDPAVLSLSQPIYFADNATTLPKSGTPLYFSVQNDGGTFRGDISARIYKGNLGKGQYEIVDSVRISRHQTFESALQQMFDNALLVDTEYKVRLCYRANASDSWHNFEPAEYGELTFTLYDPNPNLQLKQRITLDYAQIEQGQTDTIRCIINNTGAAFDGLLCPVLYADEQVYQILPELETHIDSNTAEQLSIPVPISVDIEPNNYIVRLYYRDQNTIAWQNLSPVDFIWANLQVLPATPTSLQITHTDWQHNAPIMVFDCLGRAVQTLTHSDLTNLNLTAGLYIICNMQDGQTTKLIVK